MDDDRTTRIAGITFDLGRVPVAFIKPMHVSRIRGWCSWLERGGGNKKERDEAFNMSNLFLRCVYNGEISSLFSLKLNHRTDLPLEE